MATRIDSHQHFWRYDALDYPWIDESMRTLKRDFLPDDLRPLLDAHRIDACIAVQARVSEQETEFLLTLAKQHPWIAAVIGWVDLRAPDLEQRLDRWSGEGKLLGFRHVLQDERIAPTGPDESFRRGVAALQKRRLIYELLLRAYQLQPMAEFCRANDSHWLVLDHLGKPAIRDRAYQAWRSDLEPIARLPHVVCKVSGLVTEAMNDAGAFDPDDLRIFLDAVLELFGPQRLMFGSDWPVCLLAAPYARVAEIAEQWAAGLSAAEREAIWGNTAARVYGL